MPKKQLDKEALRRVYSEKYPKYEKLAKNLKQVLRDFLNDTDVDVVDVVYRIKDFDSFWEKIERKGYKDPFREMEDICGLRIICYYPSDLKRISQIIDSEFEVLESVDTAELLEPDRFGYRSLHFVVAVKEDWLKAPNYRGLSGLKAEIQVRTILMHAWADIEHKLAYKKREHIPDQFRRRLFRVNALIESADEQFDTLRREKEEYVEGLISQEVRISGRFDVSQEMNLDSLQAFLDFYFPDRTKVVGSTRELLDRFNKFNISFRDLVQSFEKVKDFLPVIEAEVFEEPREAGALDAGWNQLGVMNWILDLTNVEYWRWREKRLPEFVRKRTKKWRAGLS